MGKEETGGKELSIQLLGGFSAAIDGKPVPDDRWRLRKVKNLVKMLALAPEHRLHRDQVIDALWPDGSLESGSNLFYQTLHAARRALKEAGSTCLVLDNGFLSLTRMATLDVDRFEAAAKKAKECQQPEVYRTALALYPGDLLPEDLYEEWAAPRREELRQQYCSLLLDLAHLEETRQNYAAGIDALLRLLAADRGSEEAHTGLMRLYALSGQRQKALRQYQTLRDVLCEELDAEPSSSTEQLYEAIQSGKITPAAAMDLIRPADSRPRHNLPGQLTSFIGREKQIAEIQRLVKHHRLVTMIGPGGNGKTRLALKSAEGLLPEFPDGVFLVELASLNNPELVPQACKRTLNIVSQPGIPTIDSLVNYFEKKSFLLLLDNCEHVISACAELVDRLLKACPKLHILATSREILAVPGEMTFRVPSLEIPKQEAAPSPDELAQVEAVRLFIERAGQAAHGFSLTSANAGPVTQISQQLDGIPLAIELAAARARMMTAAQIAARLDNAFQLLNSGARTALPRHQTLKALIDWSYDLLSPKEQLLFQRLSIFAGGWNLEAVEGICSDEENLQACQGNRIEGTEMLDLLAQLVDKSLVISETGEGETRYRMLEIIRQYANNKLQETGCEGRIRDRHLTYMTWFSAQAEPHLREREMLTWLKRIDHDLNNLRAALDWSLKSNVEAGMKIMSDLMWYWWIRGLFRESHDWIRKLLKKEAEQRGEEPLSGRRALLRARCLRSLRYLSEPLFTFSREEIRALIEESIAILRASGPVGQKDLAISRINLLHLDTAIELPAEQEQEMLETLAQEDMKFHRSEYLLLKHFRALMNGDLETGERYAIESMAICREIGDIDGISSRTHTLGLYAIFKGEYEKAEAYFRESLEASRTVGNRWMEITAQEGFVYVAMVQGQYEKAGYLNELLLKESRELNVTAMNMLSEISYNLEQVMVIAWEMGNTGRVEQVAHELIEDYSAIEEMRLAAHLFLGKTAQERGDFTRAEASFKQAASLIRPGKHPLNVEGASTMCVFLLSCAKLFQRQGKAEQATVLLGAVDPLYQRIKFYLPPRQRGEQVTVLEDTRSKLNEAQFCRAWQEGQALTPEQGKDYAVRVMG